MAQMDNGSDLANWCSANNYL